MDFASYFTVDDGTTPVFCLNNSLHDIIVSKQIVLKHLQNLNKILRQVDPDGLPGIFRFSFKAYY